MYCSPTFCTGVWRINPYSSDKD